MQKTDESIALALNLCPLYSNCDYTRPTSAYSRGAFCCNSWIWELHSVTSLFFNMSCGVSFEYCVIGYLTKNCGENMFMYERAQFLCTACTVVNCSCPEKGRVIINISCSIVLRVQWFCLCFIEMYMLFMFIVCLPASLSLCKESFFVYL